MDVCYNFLVSAENIAVLALAVLVVGYRVHLRAFKSEVLGAAKILAVS